MSFLSSNDIIVAPFAGAWIEIMNNYAMNEVQPGVAPFAGAWIEMVSPLANPLRSRVAPFAGAWIEICIFISKHIFVLSLPSRERGLK